MLTEKHPGDNKGIPDGPKIKRPNQAMHSSYTWGQNNNINSTMLPLTQNPVLLLCKPYSWVVKTSCNVTLMALLKQFKVLGLKSMLHVYSGCAHFHFAG